MEDRIITLNPLYFCEDCFDYTAILNPLRILCDYLVPDSWLWELTYFVEIASSYVLMCFGLYPLLMTGYTAFRFCCSSFSILVAIPSIIAE